MCTYIYMLYQSIVLFLMWDVYNIMCLIVTFSIQLHNFIKTYYMYNVIHVSKLIEIFTEIQIKR